MENFINRLVELVKGTASNMKRGLDGTAMEEMQAAERARNEALINRATPGGVPEYMRQQGMGTSTQSMPMRGMRPGSKDIDTEYLNSMRTQLNKP